MAYYNNVVPNLRKEKSDSIAVLPELIFEKEKKRVTSA
jgi:hypothetical protein